MWGNALYFVQNAKSANNYCHKLPSGERQIFLVEVLLGDYTNLAPDVELKMPPLNPANNQTFDSVKGYTNGSDVYMVYQS